MVQTALTKARAPQLSERAAYTDPVAWIQSQFYIPELRHLDPPAMLLDDYQQAVLREAYRTGEDGKFVYDVVVWSDIKKSIKSCIAAAVILHRALETPWGSFKVVANDLQQADSRVFYYIRRALELNKALGARATIRNYRITLDNHAVIQAIPVDPSGEAGGNDDLIEWTELHAAKGKAADSMWSEMTLSPTKHGYSQRWVDTYAGHSGEAPTLEQLYDSGVKHGRQLALEGAPDDLEVFANGKLLTLWNTRPRLPWQSASYYASEATTLTPPEFQRMHRNQWISALNAFIPMAWWDACRADVPPLERSEPLVIGVDAATTHDCFAIVAVSRKEDMITLRGVWVWNPRLLGGVVDYSEPEAELRRLCAEHNVVQIAYDPMQLADMMQRLNAEKVAWCKEFQQSGERLEADKALYDRIAARRIQHAGDPVMREHLANSDAEIDKEGHKMRILHRAPHLPMDAAVSLSMSCWRAANLNIS